LVERGTLIPVVAYSNCDEVELFLNEHSLSRQRPRDLLDFVWQVPYEPGEIRAVAYRAGKSVAETHHRTVGHPSQIKLESDTPALGADRRDIATVTIAVTDDHRTTVPWSNDHLEIKLVGPAQLFGYENGDNLDVTPHRVAYRKVFHGLARGFFKATEKEGPIELTAAGILGARLFQGSTTVTMTVSRVSLRGSLSEASFDIHYTTDGSVPTLASARYEKPMTFSSATIVRMLVLCNGRPWQTSEARFEPGLPPLVNDPRFEKPTSPTTTATAPAPFQGPRDKELVGVWIEGKRRFHFAPDGTVHRGQGDEEETLIANWWYDYPNDVHEDATATGSGALRFLDSGDVLPLRLTAPAAKELLISPDGHTRRLRKQEP
jgi:beta-galactosidase